MEGYYDPCKAYLGVFYDMQQGLTAICCAPATDEHAPNTVPQGTLAGARRFIDSAINAHQLHDGNGDPRQISNTFAD